jgi:peptidyl-prolyl cis-trans isomerase C
MSGRCSLTLLVFLTVGCHRPAAGSGAKAAAGPNGALVARVGRVELRESDVERMMARDPGAAPHRFDGPGAQRELIDGMVRFELLAQAAERAGLMLDPDVIHAQRQIAVTKLVNQTLGAAASPDGITSDEVAREYAARVATDYTLPEAAHVRHIHVSDEVVAARAAAQAKALAPNDEAGFVALAAQMSEDRATRTAGGDLGFVDENSRLPRELVAAALELKTPGEVRGPFASTGGYEVVRLVSRRAAAVSPLSSVEELIRQRLYRERRTKALDELVAKLRAETPVEVVDSQATAPDRRR